MITIYTSPTCGLCKVLKRDLSTLGKEYIEKENFEEIEEMNFHNLPILFNGEKYYEGAQCIHYVRALKGGN